MLVGYGVVYYAAHVRVGTQESLFSPPTMWVAETELRSPDSVAGAFICWAIISALLYSNIFLKDPRANKSTGKSHQDSHCQ